MLWAAVCTHWDGVFPLPVWKQEYETAKEKVDLKLCEMNSQRTAQILNQRQNCEISIIADFKKMRQINDDIDKKNARRKAVRQRSCLQRKRPVQIFEDDTFSRGQKSQFYAELSLNLTEFIDFTAYSPPLLPRRISGQFRQGSLAC